MKKALVVGIDDYPSPNELAGCVNDAAEMCALLEKNENGSPNFDVISLSSDEAPVAVYPLNPSYEPDHGEETERLKDIPVIPENMEIFHELQKCNRAGLMVPVEQPHKRLWVKVSLARVGENVFSQH